MRREDIDRAGGWNEQMLGGGEDREVAVRLVASGVELVFAQEAVGQHYYCKDWASYLADMYLAGPAGINFFQSHPERLRDIPSAKWLALLIRDSGCFAGKPRTRPHVPLDALGLWPCASPNKTAPISPPRRFRCAFNRNDVVRTRILER